MLWKRLPSEFDQDRRYCRACDRYVRTLRSPGASHCEHCDAPTELFTRADLERLRASTGPSAFSLSPDREEPPRERRYLRSA